MAEWDGRIRRNMLHRDRDGRRVRRCSFVTIDGGAGYPGSHQCSCRATVTVDGRVMCGHHLRQYLRQRERVDAV